MQLKGVAQEAIRTKNDLISLLLRAVQYMHFGETMVLIMITVYTRITGEQLVMC